MTVHIAIRDIVGEASEVIGVRRTSTAALALCAADHQEQPVSATVLDWYAGSRAWEAQASPTRRYRVIEEPVL